MKKLIAITVIVLLAGCQYTPVYTDEPLPVYKYNVHERKYELTHPDSSLRYNIFEREWVYVK